MTRQHCNLVRHVDDVRWDLIYKVIHTFVSHDHELVRVLYKWPATNDMLPITAARKQIHDYLMLTLKGQSV